MGKYRMWLAVVVCRRLLVMLSWLYLIIYYVRKGYIWIGPTNSVLLHRMYAKLHFYSHPISAYDEINHLPLNTLFIYVLLYHYFGSLILIDRPVKMINLLAMVLYYNLCDKFGYYSCGYVYFTWISWCSYNKKKHQYTLRYMYKKPARCL